MAESLDPYHAWLGIPPEEQPPNHYRLLGLTLFEDDADVIREAAIQRMAFVRTKHLGIHQELSQRILNELTGAKACLSLPDKKAAYDAQLRAELAADSDLAGAYQQAVADAASPPALPPQPPKPPSRTLTWARRAIWPFSTTVRSIDRLLLAIAGEENAILHKFLRGTAAIVVVLVLGLTAQMALPLMGSLFARLMEDSRSTPPGVPIPEPLRLRPIAPQTIDVGKQLALAVSVEDAQPLAQTDGLRFNLLPGAPSGATIDAENGTFTWTPTDAQGPGKYDVVVSVAAQDSQKAETTLTITVTRPLRLQPIGPQRVEAGKQLAFTALVAEAERWQGKLRFALGGTAPSRAKMDSQSGAFTWMPDQEHPFGMYDVAVSVEGPEGRRDQTSFKIAVTRPLRLHPIAPQTVEVGKQISLAVSVEDPERWAGNLRFRLDFSAPRGATIDPETGAFTWTPAEGQGARKYDVAVLVLGPEGRSDQTFFKIAVTRPLRLHPIARRTVEVGKQISLAVSVEDPERWAGNLRFRLDGRAPPGATIDPETGAFTWTPAEGQGARKYDVAVSVEGPEGRRAETTFTVTVTRPSPPAPVAAPSQSGEREIAIDVGSGVTLEMVLIPAGSFLMGDDNGKSDEKPVHKVTITKPFYLGKYEVTQKQWQALMGSNPSTFKGLEKPVDSVSWNDCRAFLRKLNEKHSSAGVKFSLPTEAQWEYACRAGSTTRYSFGDDERSLGEYAWYDGNSHQMTHPVGQNKPNTWGLYDMHGNVWEWCADWYDQAYYAKSPADDPTGPVGGSYRVIRGGDWDYEASFCRSALRFLSDPGNRFFAGLRVSRVLAE